MAAARPSRRMRSRPRGPMRSGSMRCRPGGRLDALEAFGPAGDGDPVRSITSERRALPQRLEGRFVYAASPRIRDVTRAARGRCTDRRRLLRDDTREHIAAMRSRWTRPTRPSRERPRGLPPGGRASHRPRRPPTTRHRPRAWPSCSRRDASSSRSIDHRAVSGSSARSRPPGSCATRASSRQRLGLGDGAGVDERDVRGRFGIPARP